VILLFLLLLVSSDAQICSLDPNSPVLKCVGSCPTGGACSLQKNAVDVPVCTCLSTTLPCAYNALLKGCQVFVWRAFFSKTSF
jgi:hypothetical protein